MFDRAQSATLAIAATFTAEPLLPGLTLVLEEAGENKGVAFTATEVLLLEAFVLDFALASTTVTWGPKACTTVKGWLGVLGVGWEITISPEALVATPNATVRRTDRQYFTSNPPEMALTAQPNYKRKTEIRKVIIAYHRYQTYSS